MQPKTSIDNQELAKFAALQDEWWNKDGDLKTLHDINPARMQYIKDHCDLADKRILDVGCGGGILTEALAKAGANVQGIDAETTAIEVANAHAKKAKLSINYQTCPIEDYAAEPFDVITCMELLEHVQDPSIIVKHCERLLKPGGMLFLSTINRSWQAYFSAIIAAEYVLKLLPKQTHDYKKFIKPSELASLIREVGLEVLSCKGINYNPFSRQATIGDSISVNYLIACRKS